MPDIESLKDRSAVGSMSCERLPIIDISPYLDPTSSEASRKTTSQNLDSACRDFGFFYVTGHGLSPDYLKSLLTLGHQFFELPQEAKDSLHIFKSQDGVRGYQKLGENVTYAKRDQQEALDIYPEPENPTSDQLNGSQPWPADSDLPGFKTTLLEYTVKMSTIGHAFMRAMADALGHHPIFDELQKDNYWVLRVIGYPPLPEEFDPEKGISCGAHTDYGQTTLPVPFKVLTLLNSPKLLLTEPSVESKDGSWIPADPVPGAFVVNIGDIIDTITGHQYKSTYHRVIHKSPTYRVSMPFFFEPQRDQVIEPLEGFLPEGSKPTQAFTYFDHLKSMIYNHFVSNDKPLPEKPNANELTQRG
ncbi:hypothetical protein L198_02004 [Cryptococcus wingfieldii CBS 7118]|uniref:Fe2OG dioxygenase domain-containing protein n=1 Tax=Cryptococcus wingfieldii CBS 7118 TaxID=1295528 RepID=A0A1E3JZH8_9TREE|nr:hypothetical protein L198_02004 [Cryptococcus wingfieldii CBS 7118]ODO05312.1 hypothetical protein L198_02004 [Cryptococcus wingfieldii CBS 7118]